MHWLLIDVSGLIAKPGTTRELKASGPILGLASGLGRVDDADPVHVDLVLTGEHEGISATGKVWGRFHLSCSRCLVEYAEDFASELDEMFYYDPAAADSRDGYEVGEDQTVTLEPMLRDAIVLSIPIKPVHADDCRGLCTVCGADLNTSDCRHEQVPVDLRWAALKDLIADEQ
jgi:uncharacterized protein